MMEIGLVIFDCDGVLIDSEVLACEVDAEIYTALGYPMTTQDVMDRFVGMSGADVDAAIERELGRKLPPDYDAAATAKLFERFRHELKPIDGVHDVLDDLARNGMRSCVASSSSPARLEFTLGLTDIWKRVAPHVFSATMVARGKPAPDLFLHAAKCMQADPQQCLVIEDSVTGITAAKAAGMRSIGFSGGSHCGPKHTQRLIDAGAERVVAAMFHLRTALSESHLSHTVSAT